MFIRHSYTQGKSSWGTFIFFLDVYLNNLLQYMCLWKPSLSQDSEELKVFVAMEQAVFAFYSTAQYLITETLIKLCIPKNNLKPFYRSLHVHTLSNLFFKKLGMNVQSICANQLQPFPRCRSSRSPAGAVKVF